MNREEIKIKLLQTHGDFVHYVASLSESDFLFSKDGKWTASQQLDHIYRAVYPLSKALGFPKILLRLLVGKANRASRSYETLKTKYDLKLEQGGKASGRFVPTEIHFQQREKLQEALLKTVSKLSGQLTKFSEKELDHYILPHPLLGKLTLREMLYFTIFHVEHHGQNTLKNLQP